MSFWRGIRRWLRLIRLRGRIIGFVLGRVKWLEKVDLISGGVGLGGRDVDCGGLDCSDGIALPVMIS